MPTATGSATQRPTDVPSWAHCSPVIASTVKSAFIVRFMSSQDAAVSSQLTMSPRIAHAVGSTK